MLNTPVGEEIANSWVDRIMISCSLEIKAILYA